MQHVKQTRVEQAGTSERKRHRTAWRTAAAVLVAIGVPGVEGIPKPAYAIPLPFETKLTASDAAAGDQFGFSVAVSGNTAIVGAFGDDDAGFNSGSAYLFDATTGNQLFRLTASDAAAFDEFGRSVAISGNTAIVGAPGNADAGNASGSAYLFDITTGNQLFKLTASDAAGTDVFGTSVAISGNTAIVGARQDDDGGSQSGSAYLFDITTGSQLFKLTASDAALGDQFGNSVAISGNTAIVGAVLDDDDGGFSSGSAYLFDISTGNQLFKLTASDAAGSDFFGSSVAISGNTVIVGAHLNDDAGSQSGSAYLFDITTGNQLFKLTASDAAAGDQFGNSVAISGNTAIVGAFRDDDPGRSDSGSAYLFSSNSDAVWKDAVSGHFGDADRWQSGTAPGAMDAIRFDHAANYAVSIDGDRAVRSMVIEAGQVGFTNGVGGKLAIDTTIDVMPGAQFEITQGTIAAGEMHLTSSLGQAARVDTGGQAVLVLDQTHSTRPNVFEQNGVLLANGGVLRLTGAATPGEVATHIIGDTVANESGVIRFNRDRERSTLSVLGDFKQGAAGRLEIGLHAPNSQGYDFEAIQGGAFDQVKINGEVHLGGILHAFVSPDFAGNASVGDRFTGVIQYSPGSLQSRFDSFSHDPIRNGDLFLGLDYRNNGLDIITLTTPRRASSDPTPGPIESLMRLDQLQAGESRARNLVLITHGTNSDVDGWPALLGAAIKSNLATPQDWDVAVMDWRDFDGSFDSFLSGAKDTARSGYEIGQSVGLWMKENGLAGYENIHLTAHSSGAWLVDGLADFLESYGTGNGGNPFIDVTLFDANDNIADPNRSTDRNFVLGDSATFGIHFLDTRPLGPASIDMTKSVLPNLFNVDVTALDDRNRWLGNPLVVDFITIPHGWPYVYYTNTAAFTDDLLSRQFGWGFSAEARNRQPQYGTQLGSIVYAQGGLVRLAPVRENGVLEIIESIFWSDVGFGPGTEIIASPTGFVEVTAENRLALATGSPAIATVLFDAATDFNVMRFDFEFTSSEGMVSDLAEGLLTVFFDGKEIFRADERFVPIGVWDSGDIFLDRLYEAGRYSIMFRLDPFSDIQSRVEISNFQIGLAQFSALADESPIPEPVTFSTMMIAATSLLWRRRRVPGPDSAIPRPG
ncbi:MAG: PQQ-binding-like beta-propeller repeat protein [Phycisphaeraceae bacterium]